MNRVERVSYEYFVRQEVLKASSQIMDMRSASTKVGIAPYAPCSGKFRAMAKADTLQVYR